MGRPDLLLKIDAIARRYNTDPMSVIEWDPERLAFAVAVYDQAMAAMDQAARQNAKSGGIGFPVVVMGAL